MTSQPEWRCATCEHWAGESDDDPDVRYVCTQLGSLYEERLSTSGNDHIVIYTSHDFGCVEWIPRD